MTSDDLKQKLAESITANKVAEAVQTLSNTADAVAWRLLGESLGITTASLLEEYAANSYVASQDPIDNLVNISDTTIHNIVKQEWTSRLRHANHLLQDVSSDELREKLPGIAKEAKITPLDVKNLFRKRMELIEQGRELFSVSTTICLSPFRVIRSLELKYDNQHAEILSQGVCHRIATKWAIIHAVGGDFKYNGLNINKVVKKQMEYADLCDAMVKEAEVKFKGSPLLAKRIDAINQAKRAADLEAIETWAEHFTDKHGIVHSAAVEPSVKQDLNTYFPKVMPESDTSYVVAIEYIAENGRNLGGHTIAVFGNCWMEPVQRKGVHEHTGTHFGHDLQKELTELYGNFADGCDHLEFTIVPVRPIRYLASMDPHVHQQLLDNLKKLSPSGEVTFQKIKKREVTRDLNEVNIEKLAVIGSRKVFEDSSDGGTILLYNADAQRLIVVPPSEAKKLAFDANNKVSSVALTLQVKEGNAPHQVHEVNDLIAIASRPEFKDTTFEINNFYSERGHMTVTATQSRELLKEAFGGNGKGPYMYDVSRSNDFLKVCNDSTKTLTLHKGGLISANNPSTNIDTSSVPQQGKRGR